MTRCRAFWIVATTLLLGGSHAIAQDYAYDAPYTSSSSTAYPDGQFASQLSAARGDCESGACDWGWGCSGSPFRTGPGRCDDWRVGPRWTGSVDGVFLFRDEIDLNALATGATAGGVAIDPTAADTLSGNVQYGAGARISLNSYWPQCKGYKLHMSYMGVFGWDAEAFDPEVPYAGPLPTPNAVETQKSLSYRSSLHSFEMNGQQVNDGPLELFGGLRYVLLNEDVSDLLDESSQPPLVPPNADLAIVGDPPQDVTDILRGMSVDNNLVGFQAGMRSDFLGITDKLYLEGFVNGGAYVNFIQRKSTFTETRTYNALDDPSTATSEAVFSTSTTSAGYRASRARAAFVSEALLGAVYQVNSCTKARLGYQVFYVTGVELGDEAFIGAGPTSGDLLLHGLFGGIEYKR